LHAPDRQGAPLRALHLRGFGGQLLDDGATIDGAAADAGLDPGGARAAPLLAEEGGTWRCTCPSLELTADGAHAVAPGFQPLESYEVALANLLPGVPRREDPSSVEEVLAWAGAEPLATREVAVVCGISEQRASEGLRPVADPRPIGQSQVWTLRAAG
jgi:hypothetical protein